MLSELLDALEALNAEDIGDVLREVAPEELKALCRHRALIRLLLALCEAI